MRTCSSFGLVPRLLASSINYDSAGYVVTPDYLENLIDEEYTACSCSAFVSLLIAGALKRPLTESSIALVIVPECDPVAYVHTNYLKYKGFCHTEPTLSIAGNTLAAQNPSAVADSQFQLVQAEQAAGVPAANSVLAMAEATQAR